jgi:hypothetical protein
MRDALQERKAEMEIYQRLINGFIGLSGGLCSLPDADTWGKLNRSWKEFHAVGSGEINRMIKRMGELQQETPSGNYENQVFIRKAEGMSFDEFKTACKKLFREKGLIKDKKLLQKSSTSSEVKGLDQ